MRRGRSAEYPSGNSDGAELPAAGQRNKTVHPAHEFCLDDGLMTPTLKLKRRAMAGTYAADIAALYRP